MIAWYHWVGAVVAYLIVAGIVFEYYRPRAEKYDDWHFVAGAGWPITLVVVVVLYVVRCGAALVRMVREAND